MPNLPLASICCVHVLPTLVYVGEVGTEAGDWVQDGSTITY
jgi:hypothetical protein